MTIQPIGFIDTHALSVLVYRERSLFDKHPTLDIWARLKLKEWKVAKAVVAKALAIIQRHSPSADLAGVSIERLSPRSPGEWLSLTADTMRFHLPIVTNPGCMVYSGMFAQHLPVGNLNYVATEPMHCAVNHGDTPRYHLLIDVRKPDVELPEAPEQGDDNG